MALAARERATGSRLSVVVFEGDLLAPLPAGGFAAAWIWWCAIRPTCARGEDAILPADVRADPPLALSGGLEIYAQAR